MNDKEQSSKSTRGRLKVFLGYASGVSKSFRMFDEGRRRRGRGQDVVVGALQPKVPPEVEPLLSSLEIIPTMNIKHVLVIDVPAILQRRPQVCLVDGLAYDNPPGSRNAHRWQDVEELLSAGITIVASVNLQYVEDQREAAEKLTGKRVTQTIPREFLNTADEIEIVDAPTEAATHGIEQPWGTHERFLLWHTVRSTYGEHYLVIALTIGCSLIGVVMFGTLAGSMLPFILRSCGLDPASASAPFVATLVDVTGLIIYFSIASFILRGILL